MLRPQTPSQPIDHARFFTGELELEPEPGAAKPAATTPAATAAPPTLAAAAATADTAPGAGAGAGEGLARPAPARVQCPHVGIGIISGSGNLQRRMAVRDTWLGQLQSQGQSQSRGMQRDQAVVRFFVARPASEVTRRWLVAEARHYNDMVLVNGTELYSSTWQQVLAIYRTYARLGCP